VPIGKVPVLPEQHRVSNQFGIPLVGSEEDPTSPREILQENPVRLVDNDDKEIEKEKKDEEIEKEKTGEEEIEKEKKDDTVEETDEVVKEKDIIDDVTGSMEIRKEQKQTPIPLPNRSLRNVSSSDKIVSKELAATVSPPTATTSEVSSTTKHKKRSISFRSKTLPGSIASMCKRHGLICSHIKNKFITHEFLMSKINEVLDHCNKVVPDKTLAKTSEIMKQEIPRLVNLAVNKDREVDPINAKEMIAKEFPTHGSKMIEELFRKHMQNTTLNLYPTTSSSTVAKATADIQQHLYLNMKKCKDKIEKMVEGDEDDESYASKFTDSVLNDDVDDSSTRKESGSHKENPENVDDNVEIEKENKDDVEFKKEKKDNVEIEKEKKAKEIEKDKNDYNVEKTNEIVKEKYVVDDVTGSMEIRKEQKQFLTEEICATDDFKESTPKAHRMPTLTASPYGKKRKHSAKESSSPQQSHKITIRKKRQSTTLIPPPGDDK
nr:hypothetical protein [Tanacetum cinerariifolium]